MIAQFVRNWRLKLELDRNLAVRRKARLARSEAAQRGFSTEVKHRAAKCREVFS